MQQRSQWPPLGLRVIIVVMTILVVALVIGTVLIYKDHPDIPTEAAIITAVVIGIPGTLFGYFQWYYPRPTEEREHPEVLFSDSPAAVYLPASTCSPTARNSSVDTAPAPLYPGLLPDPSALSSGSAHKSESGRIDTVFHFNIPLPRVSEFYGRLSERETLISRTYTQASTSIVGARRIGKTWLIQYLRLSARIKLGSRYRIGCIDATSPSCVTVSGFTLEALKSLGADIPHRMSDPSFDLADLEKCVKDLKKSNYSPVLCIDEFDIFRERQQFDINFFKGMRAVAEASLVLVIGSRDPLIEIVGEPGKTSGFFNIFEQLTLEPFHLKEAQIFVQAKGLQANFSDREKELLLEYSQTGQGEWPPLRLQLVGKEIFSGKKLAEQDDPYYYRPDDPDYWEKFEEKLERKYSGVIQK